MASITLHVVDVAQDIRYTIYVTCIKLNVFIVKIQPTTSEVIGRYALNG